MSLINTPQPRAGYSEFTPPLPGEGDVAWLAQYDDTLYALRHDETMDVAQMWMFIIGTHAWQRMYLC